MVKIKNSESLKQLEGILEGSKEFFNVVDGQSVQGNSVGKVDQFEKEKI